MSNEELIGQAASDQVITRNEKSQGLRPNSAEILAEIDSLKTKAETLLSEIRNGVLK